MTPTVRYVQLAPGEAVLMEGPPLALAPGDARVHVLACGICGSDLNALRGMVLPRGATYPIRPGHEVAGIVAEVGGTVVEVGGAVVEVGGAVAEVGEAAAGVGEAAARVAIGDLVVLHPLDPCRTCEACRSGHDKRCDEVRTLGFHVPGGMAQEVVWPADRMVRVSGLRAQEAALLPDAVATAYRALVAAAVPEDGALCVVGAGGVGTHVLMLARALHPAARLAAVVRSRAAADRVRALGATPVEGLQRSARQVREAVGAVDAVVDFSGAPDAPGEGVKMLRHGGRLVLGGVRDEPLLLGTTMSGIVSRELTVTGVFASSMDDLRAVASLAATGRLDLGQSVSRTFPLESALEAIELAAHHPSGSIVRVVITPNDRERA